ncbi:MAG: glycerate kinase [bacterium]|nr:glycerate kinase [Candidatus Kapabacteria bacterium]
MVPLAFKGTLSAAEAARVIASEIRAARPDWLIAQVPLADGGRGTVDALVRARDGRIHTVPCADALGRRVEARWGELPGRTAVIEVAECIGLADVHPSRRDPSRLSTAGIGSLVRAIAFAGMCELLVGLGDTATHDCGIGLAAELGFCFRDRTGTPLRPIGRSLIDIASIDTRAVIPEIAQLSVIGFCDVMNPILGSEGAALSFATQKGADARMVSMLEDGSRNFASVATRDLGVNVTRISGAGAAGGIGAGLAAMLNARLISGADAVLDAVGFDRLAGEADVILTGEGRVDRQTFLGKGVARIADRAKHIGRPLVVFTGAVSGPHDQLERRLNAAVISLPERTSESSNTDEAEDGMRQAVRAWLSRVSIDAF